MPKKKKKPAPIRVLYASAIYGKEEIDAVNEVLADPVRIGPGERVKKFEKKYQRFLVSHMA